MDTHKNPLELLPLSPLVFHMLLALTDRERHGYGSMLEVEGSTGGEIKMGPGTLYGTVKRMLAMGLIEESDTRPDPELDDERRRYYRLTAFGRAALQAETTRLERPVRMAQAKQAPRANLLSEGSG